ncbi:MAG: hypothetical protein ACK5LT_07070 [Lachnospirales bacterium]
MVLPLLYIEIGSNSYRLTYMTTYLGLTEEQGKAKLINIEEEQSPVTSDMSLE